VERRRRIERLLGAADLPAGILERGPALESIQSPGPESSLTPDRVFAGRYKLREKLGEGGMGEVWVADQTEPVQRRVALKVVRLGHDSSQMLARFEQERQALAMMDHPNIATVFDAGVDELGRPFFVMVLIKGVAITEYCDAERLSPQQRIELFILVCDAVQHAHQKGIIHRDLKPSNILVGLYDNHAVPKVIDFGVAKATGPRLASRSIYTEIGSLIGTLEYMSPEQAEPNNIDVDTRSDIYSLGAVLYELLTGSVPFSRKELQSAAFVEMLRIIKEVEPPKPSTKLSGSGTLPNVAAVRRMEPRKLIGLMRGDLDWIAVKCLEKSRTRRYETANGLAMDLQRYLANEVVSAAAPSAGYRLRKFVRRNWRVVLTLSALAVVWDVSARANRERAETAADRAARQSWANASVSAAIQDARTRTDEAWRLTDQPSRMQLATDAAKAAIDRANEIIAGGVPDDEIMHDYALTRRAVLDLQRHATLISSSNRDEQLFADALTGHRTEEIKAIFCKRAIDSLRAFEFDPIEGEIDALANEIAASRIRDVLLGLMLGLHFHTADRATKTRFGNIVRAARKRCGGSYWRWQELLDTRDVNGLVKFAASPEALTFRSGLVGALVRDLRDAKQEVACREFLRRAAERYPDDAWLHYDLYAANRTGQSGDLIEALQHISAAHALRPKSGLFCVDLGSCFHALKAYGLAILAYRQAVDLCPDSARAHAALGGCYETTKNLTEALPLYQTAVRLDPAEPVYRVALALGWSNAGKHHEAFATLRDALRENPQWGDNPHNNVRYNAASLAMMRRRQGRIGNSRRAK
jgi:serine/threonine protein kinase/tetratricopeptide (TPR) repeat protein